MKEFCAMEDNQQESKREKPRRKRRGKLLLLLILILLAAIAAALYLGRGLGLGPGDGPSGPPPASDSPAPSDSAAPPDSQESAGREGADITVEVTQNRYLVDGEEATLEEIEEMIQRMGLNGGTATVRDNYGSAKAHDELTALLAKYGISAVME